CSLVAIRIPFVDKLRLNRILPSHLSPISLNFRSYRLTGILLLYLYLFHSLLLSYSPPLSLEWLCWMLVILTSLFYVYYYFRLPFLVTDPFWICHNYIRQFLYKVYTDRISRSRA